MDKALTDAISVAAHYGVTDAELAAAVESVTAAKRAEADVSPGQVTILHPDGVRRLLVDADAVPVFEASGWHLAPVEPEPDSKPVAEPPVDAKPKTTKEKTS